MSMTTRKILLIDDDPLFGRLFSRKAGALGLELHHRSSLIESLYTQNLAELDLVITDCVMPEANGLDVVQYLAAMFPKVPVLLVSESSKTLWRYASFNGQKVAAIEKSQGIDTILERAMTLMQTARPKVMRNKSDQPQMRA